MQLRKLENHLPELTGKTVVIRTNFDVPMENGTLQDTTRIEDSLPSLMALRQQQCRIIILSHAGRPEGKFSNEYTLEPVVSFLESKLHEPVSFIPYTTDYHQLNNTGNGICLIDNLRFYPEEEANDPGFTAHLATFGEVFVNEAFANCHRAHASMLGLATSLPSYAGLSLAKEMAVLTQVTQTPKRPLVVVIGGAKLETKEPLVQAFAQTADTILVGGKVALDMRKKGNPPDKIVLAELIPDGKDITPGSAAHFASIIMNAGTVIWNGSLGMFEEEAYRQGTTIVAQAINQTPGFTLIGGGDTEAALTQLNLEAGIDYISTGGGAMLTYLSEGTLVSLQPLLDA
jgi:phosphoglycerate kinase